jgi:hypothetical protein
MTDSLPVPAVAGLIRAAIARLAAATTAAEVLDARDAARFAYDAARSAARFARAKQAHADVLAAVRQAQADALEVEAEAQIRLAEEFDAAQQRGELASGGRPKTVRDENGLAPATAADLGLSRREIHEARQLRDAEAAQPGVVRRVLHGQLEADQEPTRAAIRREVSAAIGASPNASRAAAFSRMGERAGAQPVTLDLAEISAAAIPRDMAHALRELRHFAHGRTPETIVAELGGDRLDRLNVDELRWARDFLRDLTDAVVQLAAAQREKVPLKLVN